MSNTITQPESANTNSTATGAGIGALGFSTANVARHAYRRWGKKKPSKVVSKVLRKGKTAPGLLSSTLSSLLFGGIVGGLTGSYIPSNNENKEVQKVAYNGSIMEHPDFKNTVNLGSGDYTIEDDTFKDKVRAGAHDASQFYKRHRKAINRADAVAGLVGTAYAGKKAYDKLTDKQKTAGQKETYTDMNNDLVTAALRMKTAADMTIPLEQKPTPEPGSQPVQGMTNNATYNPASVGSATYGGSVDATALAKAKEKAMCAVNKQAAANVDTASNWVKRPKGRFAEAVEFLKKNKGRVAGAGAAAAALTAGSMYGYKKYKEKQASAEDLYAEKVASVMETGVDPEEACMAMDAAEAMYNECLEKMAFAEELYGDAVEYLGELEKQAAEYTPVAGSALGGAIGATAGLAAAGRFAAPRAGMIGAAIGGAVGGALGNAAVQGAPALAHFAANLRN